jgi:hypothetical protein
VKIRLTSDQYSALKATPGARKRLAAACSPLEGGDLELALGANNLETLRAVNPGDLADAVTRVRWSTMRGGALFASLK